MIATWTSNMQTLILLVWEIGGYSRPLNSNK